MIFDDLDILLLIKIKIDLKKAYESIGEIKKSGILNREGLDFKIDQYLLDANIIDYIMNVIDSVIKKKINNLTSEEEIEKYKNYIEIQYKIREEQAGSINNNLELKKLLIELEEYENYVEMFKNKTKGTTNIVNFKKLEIYDLITIKIKLEKIIYSVTHIKESGILLNEGTNEQETDLRVYHQLLDVETIKQCIKIIDDEIIKRIDNASKEELENYKYSIESIFKEKEKQSEQDKAYPLKMKKMEIEEKIKKEALMPYENHIINRQRKSQ